MKVLMVGIGALGGTIAARAINAGVPVRLAARNTDSAEALRRLGLRVSGIGGEVRADAIDGDQQRAPSSFVKVAPPEPAVTKRREIWKTAAAAARRSRPCRGGPLPALAVAESAAHRKRHRRARRLRQ